MIDNPATFVGGDEAFREHIQSNCQLDGKILKNENAGIVQVQFEIEKDGSVANIVVIKGRNCIIADEAVRLLRLSPKWIPGRQKDIVARHRVVHLVFFIQIGKYRAFVNQQKQTSDYSSAGDLLISSFTFSNDTEQIHTPYQAQ